jgi:Ni,Fe-hydrogenase I cytochrome b subunit
MSRTETISNPATSGQGRVKVHSLGIRLFHWLNAVAIVVMIMSGWRI